MRIVLTGADGYLGSAIASELHRQGFELTGFVRKARSHVTEWRTREVELTDQAAVSAAVAAAQPDAVVHCAGRVRGNALDLYRDNTVATIVLAEAILACAPAAILTAVGSAAEYGEPRAGAAIKETDPCYPKGVYGHAKLAASQYLASVAGRGLRHNLVRPFNLVGVANSSNQVIGSFLEKAQQARVDGKPVRMGRLDAVRDFIAVTDLVSLIIQLVAGRQEGEVVNACSGRGVCVRDLVQFLAAKANPPIEVIEEGQAPPADAEPDVIIGDPAKFLSLIGLVRPTRVEDVLDAAWCRATALADSADQTQPEPETL